MIIIFINNFLSKKKKRLIDNSGYVFILDINIMHLFTPLKLYSVLILTKTGFPLSHK